MNRYFLVFIISLSLQSTAYANWFSKIGDLIKAANSINGGILNAGLASLDVQRNILSSQRNIEQLIRQMSGNTHSGWGTYGFHDYQSYGQGANDWEGILRMADSGYGDGAFGGTLNRITQQFPIKQQEFNRGVTDTRSQQYYSVKSQTVMATRAVSQHDYNTIYEQIQYQQMLQQQIEKTNDVKAAIDLNNRLQVEGNLIQLAMLREIALSNQQQAITEQATVNAALSNAMFLNRP